MSDDAFRHCDNLVRAHDKDRYLASLFAPAGRRRYLLALYAFDYEIARIKVLASEPLAGMIRLQWWLEAVSGQRPGEAAASPVMTALLAASAATGVDLAPLVRAVEARQNELEMGFGLAPPIAAASVIFSFAAQLVGADRDAVAVAADAAGRAVTLIEDPEQVRDAYAVFRKAAAALPEVALPAFLPVALVPLRLRISQSPQWRRQIVLARAAWFGFPKL